LSEPRVFKEIKEVFLKTEQGKYDRFRFNNLILEFFRDKEFNPKELPTIYLLVDYTLKFVKAQEELVGEERDR